MKKVSIIVPVYNVEKYVKRCIESIIHQSYKNIEIIVVNDGSNDGSKKICEEACKKDNRIIYLEKENGGLSSARNYGLKYMTGEYVFFVDSDDWIESDTIEYLVTKLEENGADMSICGVYDVKGEERITRYAKEEIVVTNYQALDLLSNDGYKIGIVVWNKLYKKEIFKKIKFEEGKINEDVYFTPKAIYLSEKIYVSTMPKYNYLKKRSGSICNNQLTKKNLDVVEAEINNAIYFKRQKEEKLYFRYMCTACSICMSLYCQARKGNHYELKKYIEEKYIEFNSQYFKCINLIQNKKEWMMKMLFENAKDIYYKIWKRRNNG